MIYFQQIRFIIYEMFKNLIGKNDLQKIQKTMSNIL